jgi:hypothetical protein
MVGQADIAQRFGLRTMIFQFESNIAVLFVESNGAA